MTSLGGRRRGRMTTHTPGTMTVLLQSRVRPEFRDVANQLADACGVSMGLFLEELVRRVETDPATGRPVWWDTTGPNPLEEELPLADAS